LVFMLRGACVQWSHNPLFSRESNGALLPSPSRAASQTSLSAMAAPGSARCHRRPPARRRHLARPRRYRPGAAGAPSALPPRHPTRAPALPARPRHAAAASDTDHEPRCLNRSVQSAEIPGR
jgi:hypothetical protein